MGIKPRISKKLDQIGADAAGGVSNVFGRTGSVVAEVGDYNTDQVTEGSNKYYSTTLFDTDFALKDTDDLTEGLLNLYFTDTRAYNKVKAILQAGTNINITPNDVAETLTIESTASGGGGASPFTATIAPSGGDYSDFSTAIAGESDGAVFLVQPGTYTDTGITKEVKSGMKFIGKDRDTTLLTSSYTVNASFTSPSITAYTTGTVSITKYSKTLTGSGTSWVGNVQHGDLVGINNSTGLYKVNRVLSNTSIELQDTFTGDNVSGIPYGIFTPMRSVVFENITFENFREPYFKMGYFSSITFRNCRFRGRTTGSQYNIAELYGFHDINFINCEWQNVGVAIRSDSVGTRYDGNNNIYIERNSATNVERFLELKVYDRNVYIDKCYISGDNAELIRSSAAGNLYIINSEFVSDSGTQTIVLQAALQADYSRSINNCIFSLGNTSSGIQALSCDFVTVQGCKFFGGNTIFTTNSDNGRYEGNILVGATAEKADTGLNNTFNNTIV